MIVRGTLATYNDFWKTGLAGKSPCWCNFYFCHSFAVTISLCFWLCNLAYVFWVVCLVNQRQTFINKPLQREFYHWPINVFVVIWLQTDWYTEPPLRPMLSVSLYVFVRNLPTLSPFCLECQSSSPIWKGGRAGHISCAHHKKRPFSMINEALFVRLQEHSVRSLWGVKSQFNENVFTIVYFHQVFK